jgi:hypothetical protein
MFHILHQAAATTAAGLDLPPPPHQTFDEAERLEALKDLPPGLWDKHEFVAGTYGVGGTGGADGQVARSSCSSEILIVAYFMRLCCSFSAIIFIP